MKTFEKRRSSLFLDDSFSFIDEGVSLMDVEHIVNAAIIQILRDNVFYGHIICQLSKVYTSTVQTMAIGKRRGDILVSLFINPEYISEKYKNNSSEAAFEHIVQVIRHEIFHLIFNHISLQKSNHHKQEIACECSVNSYIDRSKLLDKGVFPEDFGLPSKLGFEEYYSKLDIPEYKNIIFKIGVPKKSNESKASGVNDKNEEIIYLQDSHGEWQTLQDNPVTNIMIKDIIRKSKERAISSNSWGDVPDEIRETIDSFLSPEENKISWEVALRDFISSSSETILDYTNKKPSKRFGTRPGTKKDDILNLAIGIDTSGSINTNQLRMFFSELYWISKQNVRITVFECDYKIGKEYDFSEWNEEDFITGGGGTDLTPVIKEAQRRKFDALIYFTDGYAPKVEYDFTIPILLVIPREGMFHISKNELPCDCQMVFFIEEDGSVTVE